jgi:hypothetical protein
MHFRDPPPPPPPDRSNFNNEGGGGGPKKQFLPPRAHLTWLLLMIYDPPLWNPTHPLLHTAHAPIYICPPLTLTTHPPAFHVPQLLNFLPTLHLPCIYSTSHLVPLVIHKTSTYPHLLNPFSLFDIVSTSSSS